MQLSNLYGQSKEAAMTNEAKTTLLSHAYALILSWPEPEGGAAPADQDGHEEHARPGDREAAALQAEEGAPC